MSFGNFGFSEILIIAVLVLIFFGPRRMPEIGRALGGALREFRRGLNEIQRELQEAERAASIKPDKTGSPSAARPGSVNSASRETSKQPEPKAPTPLAAALRSPSEPASSDPPFPGSADESLNVQESDTEGTRSEPPAEEQGVPPEG